MKHLTKSIDLTNKSLPRKEINIINAIARINSLKQQHLVKELDHVITLLLEEE
jgi:hypothetical protein